MQRVKYNKQRESTGRGLFFYTFAGLILIAGLASIIAPLSLQGVPPNAIDLSLSGSIYSINPKHEIRNPKQIQNPNFQNSKQKQHRNMLLNSFYFDHFYIGHLNLFRISIFEFRIFLKSTALTVSPSTSSHLDYQGPANTTAKETIKSVRDSLNRIKPFKVKFVQQVYTDEQPDIQESGEIIFKNDQLLKWTYLDPDYKVFLLEGDNYQFYDQDNEQLIIGKIKDKSHQWVWQMLFSDDIFRDYLVTWEKSHKRIHIKNNPNSKPGDTSDITIDIEIIINDDSLPITLIQDDPSGARIVYHFKEYKPKINIPGDVFRLSVPDDVEIIRE